MRQTLSRLLLAAITVHLACRCGTESSSGGDTETEGTTVPDPAVVSLPATNSPTQPPTELVVTAPSQLEGHALDRIETLDLALSVPDAREHPGEGPPPDEARCEGLDLVRLAEKMPKLRALRVSGCQEAVHAGLGSFTGLTDLEVADLRLDGVTIARIAQLRGLRRLAFTRVEVDEDESLGVLGRELEVQTLVLRELQRDSPIAALLGDFRSLREAHLEGEWAGYNTATALSHAKKLERLVLQDTAIGNYALTQIKPLTSLTSVDLTGSTFTDGTPLRLRELPIEQFRCACPRFGDTGLKHLRYLSALESLDLPQSRISGDGLAGLEDLARLEHVRISYRPLENTAFEALAHLESLQTLHLEKVELLDPGAEHLGELTSLRRLTIDAEAFDDACASQLATLVDLRELDLSGTAISDRGLEALAGLDRLTILRLHHTRVTNKGLSHLAGLRQLRVLDLDHTDLVDHALVHLSGLTSLEELRLDHTLVTDEGLDHLLKLDSLSRLNLAGTVVSAEGVAKLRTLPSLTVLGLEGTRARGGADRHVP